MHKLSFNFFHNSKKLTFCFSPSGLTTMVRVEGTIKRIICTKNSTSKCPWIIAEIEQADGETTTIKGNVSCNAEVNDYLCGDFDLKDSMYGQQYETKNIVSIIAPCSYAAVMARMTELAHSVKIRVTGPVKTSITALIETEIARATAAFEEDNPGIPIKSIDTLKGVWWALNTTTDPVLFDLQIKAEEYNKRYKKMGLSPLWM